ncbi:MAG: hypothetical protein P4L35_19495 [Ignavibacteriaceae bacterium]|nr:hypothetical protein [Ignavibacteriaceae bacterium]
MNKNVNTWIEEKGTVRTVFRKIALWDYASRESCRLQLIHAIEKEEITISPFGMKYAIDSRKVEIQWISVILPLLPFVSALLFFLYGAMNSHIVLHLSLCIILMVSLGLVYKITFFNQYLEAKKLVYYSGDAILREVSLREAPDKIGAIQPSNFASFPAEIKDVQIRDGLPLLLNKTIESATPAIDIETQSGNSFHVPEAETGIIKTTVVSEIAGKGCINTLLLHELIKKECGRPNIYRGDIHKSVEYYSHITGCKAKNILDKKKLYEKRDTMDLKTANARTTHLKYLELLLGYYLEIGDDILYNKAEDLQSFIETSAQNKK